MLTDEFCKFAPRTVRGQGGCDTSLPRRYDKGVERRRESNDMPHGKHPSIAASDERIVCERANGGNTYRGGREPTSDDEPTEGGSTDDERSEAFNSQ